MERDISACNTYNYGEAEYWDARYLKQQQQVGFDWYQNYSALRPFLRNHIPNLSSPILVLGCGNAVISEDMANDGYEDIMNVDISSVAIDMMKRKHVHVQQLKCILTFRLQNYIVLTVAALTTICFRGSFLIRLTDMQMDVRDMSFFPDASFLGIIDKGTLDSLMCGTEASESAAQMLGEVSRLLKPGGVYMLITYGDPKARMPCLNQLADHWKIELYIIPKPGFQRSVGSTSMKSYLEPVSTTEEGLLPPEFVLEDPDSHFIYVCKKMEENTATYVFKK